MLKQRASGAVCEPVKRTKALPRLTKKRRKVRGAAFVYKGNEAGTRPRFPLPNPYHAKLALVSLLRIAGRHGTGEPYRTEARKVLQAIKKKFPNVYGCELDVVASIAEKFNIQKV